MRATLTLSILLVPFILLAQSERDDIISKNIQSITKSYWAPDSSQKITIKNYYTVRGDDSLEYYCGKLTFRFKTFLTKNSRVERLERYDAVDRLDELHIYKYEKDGSYTIEIVAHGAGTIIFSTYDKNNRCLKQTFSGVESLHFKYDSTGRLKNILYNEKDEKPVEIAVVEYGKDGKVYKIIGLGDQKQTEYFKYNLKGLCSEKTSVRIVENGKEERETVFYEYEFRE